MLGGVCRLDTHKHTRSVYCNSLCVTLCTELLLPPLTNAQHGVLDDFKFAKLSHHKNSTFSHKHKLTHSLSLSRSALMYDYNLRAEAVSLRLYLSSSGQ